MSQMILVSAFVTNPQKLKQLEGQWKLRDKEHKKVIGRSAHQVRKLDPTEFGGAVFLIDADDFKKGIIKRLECPLAMGMAYKIKTNTLLVASSGKIIKYNNGKVSGEINHNLFNDIHDLHIGNNNHLMVSCTGTDSLVEINLDTDEQTWDWLATENGYGKSPSGKTRVINRGKNYNYINTITPDHTTHINTAIYQDDGNILATLFHQGQLVKINKRTGSVDLLLSGLSCPHHVRRIEKGYILSDTRNNRILLVDNNYKIVDIIFNNKFDWIQDAIVLNNGSFLTITGNHSLCNVDQQGKCLGKLNFDDKPVKFFCFLKITPEQIVHIFG